MVNSEEGRKPERADAEALIDIQTVAITGDSPDERLGSFLRQVGNPYCYRVGKTAVRVSFLNDGESLTNKLRRYLLDLKRG